MAKKEILKGLVPGKNVLKRADGRVRVVTCTTGKSKVDVSAAKQTGINEVLKRYALLRQPLPGSGGSYLDNTIIPDYHNALNRRVDSVRAFNDLPISLRKRFGSVDGLASFLLDPANKDEAIKLNLMFVDSPPPAGVPEVKKEMDSPSSPAKPE